MAVGSIREIVECPFPKPWNFMDLKDGESVELVIKDVGIGTARAMFQTRKGMQEREVTWLRAYLDISTPWLGAPIFDTISTRLQLTLQTLIQQYGKPLRVKLTAYGKEPNKYYTVQVLQAPKKRQRKTQHETKKATTQKPPTPPYYRLA